MQRKNRIKFFVLPVLGLGIFWLLNFIKADATDAVAIYVTPPISSTTILPTSDISSSYLTSTISVSASPGEYKPASFTVKANSAVNQMTVTASNLTSGLNTITSGNIDIKTVKVWWQAGSGDTIGTAQLVPELLLKDDSVIDVVGNANYLKVSGWVDATAVGFYAGQVPTSTTGQIGEAISFDGSNGYMNMGDIADYRFTESTSSTVSFWFKGSCASFCEIVEKRTGDDFYRFVMESNGSLYFEIGDGSGNTLLVDPSTNLNDGSWHHAVVIYDGANLMTGYVDGVSVGTDSSPTLTGLNTTGGSLKIGKGTNGAFNGAIDDVRIYNTALTTAEVTSLYTSTGANYTYSAAPSTLVGWWTMDDIDSATTTVVYGRGNQYILASDPDGISGIDDNPTVTAFPVRDSTTLRPVDIGASTNKQFWATIYVPAGTTDGTYTGTITLASGGTTLGTLTLNLTVLPITLAAPSLEYNIYYTGLLADTGTIGYQNKNTAQMTAELADLYKHGITNPTIYGQASDVILANILDIRASVGISNAKIYHCLGSPTVGVSVSTTTLQDGLTTKLAVLAPYGTTEFYIYGDDEADMYPVRTKMDAAHAVDTKVKIWNAQGSTLAVRVPDKLDVGVIAWTPDAKVAETFHEFNNKVFNYANPATATEDADDFRRNYGLLLWQKDYDGEMTYVYQANSGNIWDDWAPGSGYRQFVFAYPTADGVISTIQEEGMREAVNDIRYLTTLQNLIASPPAGKSITSADNYLDTLKAADITTQDLDAVRQRMIDYILYFLDEGSAPTYDARCGNGVIETGEECEGNNLNGGTCTSLGYTAGTLSCDTLCQYRESSCTPPASLSINYSTSTDYDSGYINKAYINYGLSVTSASNTSAYADLTGSDQTLIVYWGMNEATSTLVSDLSNSGNGGVLATGDYETADDGTTSSTIQESGTYVLAQSSSFYDGWTVAAITGAASGTTRLVGNYNVASYLNSRQIYPLSPLADFASGDQYHLYYDGIPTWTEGVRGSAVQFDGNDDYIQFGTVAPSISEIGGNKVSMSVWFKSDTTDQQYILHKNGALRINITGNKKIESGVFTAQGDGYEHDYTVTGSDDVVAGRWYHVVTVYDGSSIKLYINGVLADTDTLIGDVSSEGCMQIGKYNNGGCYGASMYYFDGIIDEVMIFKRALSLSEVRSLYNANLYPLNYVSAHLTAGAHGVLARAIDAAGAYLQTVTSTITIATSTAGSALNFINYGLAHDLKLLAGSSYEQMRILSSSTFRVKANSGDSLIVGEGSRSLQLTPSGGEINLFLDTGNLSGSYVTQWTASSSISGTSLSTIINVPKSNTNYIVKVDGNTYGTYRSNNSGDVTFTYSGGFSTKEFTISEESAAESAPSSASTFYDIDITRPSNLSITPGQTASAEIYTKAIYEKGSVIFSAEGLPNGVTASFLPGVCELDCTTTLSLKASSSVKAGNYIIYVVATGTGNDISKKGDMFLKVEALGTSIVATPAPGQGIEEIPITDNNGPTPAQPGETEPENPVSLETLSFGAHNEEVVQLQNKLKALGYLSPDIDSTGYFGPKTKEAVIEFQKSAGIPPTGIYGPLTQKALVEKALGPKEFLGAASSSPSVTSGEQPIIKKPGIFQRIYNAIRAFLHFLIEFFKKIFILPA